MSIVVGTRRLAGRGTRLQCSVRDKGVLPDGVFKVLRDSASRSSVRVEAQCRTRLHLVTTETTVRAQGGLGLSLSSFTPSIIFGGVVMAIFSLTYYPAYQRRVGPLNACKACTHPQGWLGLHVSQLCLQVL